METMEDLVAQHPFAKNLSEDFLGLIAGCGRNVKFDAGTYLCREGDDANQFFLIRHGRVGIEIAVPDRDPLLIQTVGDGDIVGASWLVPPYRWAWDVRALTLTRAIAFDCVCLRGKCEENHDLGYELMKRFAPILINRLQAARLQLLDIYGGKS